MRLKIYLTMIMLFTVTTLGGCGSSLQESIQAKRSCLKGQRLLKERVAPEFNKLVSATSFPISSPDKYGCAMVFTRVLEEIPGEVMGEYISSTSTHELAFLMIDYEGREILTFPPTPQYREGIVNMQVKLAEVFGGGNPELVIEESSAQNLDRSKALRIFMYAEGVPIPKEIFSQPLIIKSSSGRKLPATWAIAKFQENPAIILRGGGKQHLHLWDDSLQAYRYDPNASQKSLAVTPSAVPGMKRTPPPQSPLPAAVKVTPPASSLSTSRVTRAKQSEDDYKFDAADEDESRSSERAPSTAPSQSPPPAKSGDKVTTVDDLLEGL